jgi:iron complex outermembrane recepter protein
MKILIPAGFAAAVLCASAWAQPPDDASEHEHELEPAVHGHGHDSLLAQLEPVVVTAVAMRDPWIIVTDPRQPRLPLPAHDGGSYLKSIPGFSVSRKGGTSGDPELRGLGGSRLNILLDDAHILGGCGGRMDPPTAYVYPEAYDRIEVIKGPQSVRYGPTVAGVVLFDRDPMRFTAQTLTGYGSVTAGSFDRRDFVGDITAGDRLGYVRLIGTLSNQDDYKDGAGRRVHSQYDRWSTTAILGWTPDERTTVEFTTERSDAQAAYDDRGMDGVIFDRTGYTLSVARTDITPWLTQLKAVAFYNYIDHVMDNYTLRAPPTMPMVSYPDRRTVGARITADISLGELTTLSTGTDWSENLHASNRVGGMAAFGYREVPREDNAEFTDSGAFVELERLLGERSRLNAGLRADHRRSKVLDGMSFGGAEPGARDSSNQQSGFVRFSHDLPNRPVTLHAGLGRAERAPDFWELRRVFELDTEKLTQLDVGAGLRTGDLSANLALFYGKLDDYILIASPGPGAVEARNIDATTRGLEADLSYRVNERLSATVTAAWVRSNNDTDNVPLAQTPPLEGTLSVDYDAGRWFGGVLLRGVARQDRIHPGFGTIYSLDSDETPGFGVISAYGGWRINSQLTATAGIDNLADKAYSEHIQRGSADLGASERRIFEPGRTLWLRLATEF